MAVLNNESVARSRVESEASRPQNEDELATKWELRQIRDALCERGHVPGLALTQREFLLAVHAYSQAPGRFAKYRHTIARETGDCPHAVRDELGMRVLCHCAQKVKKAYRALADHDVLTWEIIAAKHPLPWRGEHGFAARADNRLCKIVITKRHAAALAKRLGLALNKTPSTGFCKTPSTRSRSSSLREEDLNNHHLGETPAHGSGASAARSARRKAKADSPAAAGDAVMAPSAPSPVSSEGSATNVPPAMARVLALWKKTGLPEPGRGRAPTVLANRHRELVLWGKFTDDAAWTALEHAVLGTVDNMRFLASKHCQVPFAVVFKNLENVEGYAHQGRKRVDAHAAELAEEQRARDDDRKARAAIARQDAAEAAEAATRTLGPLPPAAPPPRAPLTPEETARKRADDLERARAEGLFDDPEAAE